MASTRTNPSGRQTADPVSLPDTLRALDDDRLAALLRSRPDLLTPIPADLDQLATRAATHSSVHRALDRLDRFELAIVEAIVVAGPPVAYDSINGLLGVPEKRLRGGLEALRTLGLVWGPDDALQVPRPTAELLGTFPAGLGPPAAEQPRTDLDPMLDPVLAAVVGGTSTVIGVEEGAAIDRALDELGPEARALAEHLAAGTPLGRLAETPTALDGIIERMLARGLLVSIDRTTVALTRAVGLHLRGGLLPAGTTDEPPLDGPHRDPALVDRGAAGSALEAVQRVEQLLEAFGQSSPSVLRSGGLGVRDLRRLAGRLDVDETTAALFVEVAAAAGLLAIGDGDPAGWLPTEAYDRWLAADLAVRWAYLAAAWAGSTRVPALVGTRDERDKPRSALTPEVRRSSAPEFRQLVLTLLSEAPAGTALDAETVLARLRWRRPRRSGPFVTELAGWTLREAAVFGLTGLGALAAPGRMLVAEPGPLDSDGIEEQLIRRLADTLRPLLPEPVEHVLLQADLTAVAPGPLQPEFARRLALVADAESHGGATVYRFGPDSIRRALDAGQTAAEVHQLLAEHSTTPVPQPLAYLVDDVARRHGRLRAGTAAAYLRCDDEALLATVLADKRTQDLGLRALAPTVLVSRVPVRALVEELRSLGYAPAAEAPDGALMLSGPRTGRAPGRNREAGAVGPGGTSFGSGLSGVSGGSGGVAAAQPTLLTAAVRALRAGDRARSARPDSPRTFAVGRTASVEVVRVLRTAVDEGWTVWIGYADQHGGTSDRVVEPVRLDPGTLTAYDHAAGTNRAFLLHRITGVARVD